MISRQRSCVHCADAKRRCIPRLPKCSRCVRRGLRCSYKNEPLAAKDDYAWKMVTPTLSANAVAETQHLGEPSGWDAKFSGNPGIRSLNEAKGAPEFIQQATLGPSVPYPGDFPPSDLTIVVLKTPELRFLVRKISYWPSTFVSHLEAPFIYPSTKYASSPMPSPMQKAFLACMGYASRTPTNNSLVLGIVESTVNDFLRQPPCLLSYDEHIETLQALLLLHTIQLWDGDVRQRARAESQSQLIEEWAVQLHLRLTSSASLLPDAVRSMVHENARRSILMTFLSQAIYEVTKVGFCSYVPRMVDLPFTHGLRDLKLKQNPPGSGKTIGGLVTYGDFTTEWKRASRLRGISSGCARVLDEFTKMLLIPCVGLSADIN